MENELQNRILAILFASGEPVELTRLCGVLGLSQPAARMQLAALEESLSAGALTILELEGSYQLTNRPAYAADIRAALELTRNTPLSQAALEVLAVVAYNQPVTRAFIEEVRGVDCSSILSGLTDKALLEEAGRLELPGRPIAYRTTANFLRVFGLRSLEELPEPAATGGLPGQLGIFDLPEAENEGWEPPS